MNMWTWGPALHELQNGRVTLKTQAKRPPWGRGGGWRVGEEVSGRDYWGASLRICLPLSPLPFNQLPR